MAFHIAFLHNLQRHQGPEEAEFDTPETVEAIRSALTDLGHRVSLVEASLPTVTLASTLESMAPDLVLNTAEGTHGRFREGFYPGLLEQLKIPYTGSDAYVCTLTLDKHLTKLMVAERGIQVPRWRFVTEMAHLADHDLTFPVIAKPNFEGSSKGITQASVAADQASLEELVTKALREYPSGLLVEEFIQGQDVTVPYLAEVGVMEPARYHFGGPQRAYGIYDYELKQERPDDVEVICPAGLPPEVREKLRSFTQIAVDTLGVLDFGRVDYRVTESGQVYFIEINALPSLEPGAAIYLAAAEFGLKKVGDVLSSVIKSAAKRQKIKKPANRKKLVVGLAYNLKRKSVSQSDDGEAEFDSEATISALLKALEANGHEARPLEATSDFPSKLQGVDLVFNVAEGLRGRNRESQVPALLELMGVPYTGSDATALAITLDKGLAKRIVRQSGVPTANFLVMRTGKEKLPPDLQFPLFVKPLAEGSSKGIVASRGVVRDEASLREVATGLIERYRQPALVEEFLPGREFTVGLLDNGRIQVMPPMEILFGSKNENRVYAFEHKLDDNDMVSFQVPAELSSSLERELKKMATAAFRALGCRDFARIDLRLDGDGKVNFIECNPLPGLSPGFSDLCVIAQAAGIEYEALIGKLMAPALRRRRALQRSTQNAT